MKKLKSLLKLLIAISLLTSLNFAIPPQAKAAAACNVNGITSADGTKVYYYFTTVGVCEWTRPAGVTSAEYLLVGGGGGGGGGRGGGGGGGGVLTGTWNTLNEYSSFNIWVGAGGAGSNSTQRGGNGGWSAIVPPDSGVPGLYLWAGGGGGGGSGNTEPTIQYGAHAPELTYGTINQIRGSGGGAGFNFAIAPTRYWGLGGTGVTNGGNTYLCTEAVSDHNKYRSTGGGGGAGVNRPGLNANGGGFGSAGTSLPSQCRFYTSVFGTLYDIGWGGNSNGGVGQTNTLIQNIIQLNSSVFNPFFYYGNPEALGGGGGGSDGRGANETGYEALGAGAGGDGGGGTGEIIQSGYANNSSAGRANTGGGGGGGVNTGKNGGSGLVVLVVTKATPTISYASSIKTAMLKKKVSYSLPAASASNGFGVSIASTTPAVCTISGTTITFVSSGTCSFYASTAASDGFYAATKSDSVIIVNNNTQNVLATKFVDPRTPTTQKVTLTKPNIVDPYSGSYELHTCIDVVGSSSATTGNFSGDVYIGIDGSYDQSKVSITPAKIRINASKSLTDTYLSNLYVQAAGLTRLTKINNSSLYLLIRTNLIADPAEDALDAYCDDENKNWVQIKSSTPQRSRNNIGVTRPTR